MTTNQLITRIGRQRVITALSNVVCGGSGSGDVSGPSSSTANAIVLFNGATGKIIKDSGVLLSALQTALGFNPSRRILYRSNVSASLTGTTSETLIDSFLIPGGTVQANDWIDVKLHFTRTGAAGAFTNRLRIHTANQVSGATVIANAWAMNTGQLMQQTRRTIRMKNSVSAQEAFPSAAITEDDITVTGSAILTMTQDFSNNQYIIVSGQLANSADTLTLRSWMIELIRQ